MKVNMNGALAFFLVAIVTPAFSRSPAYSVVYQYSGDIQDATEEDQIYVKEAGLKTNELKPIASYKYVSKEVDDAGNIKYEEDATIIDISQASPSSFIDYENPPEYFWDYIWELLQGLLDQIFGGVEY